VFSEGASLILSQGRERHVGVSHVQIESVGKAFVSDAIRDIAEAFRVAHQDELRRAP
jgi:hypothetical protein